MNYKQNSAKNIGFKKYPSKDKRSKMAKRRACLNKKFKRQEKLFFLQENSPDKAELQELQEYKDGLNPDDFEEYMNNVYQQEELLDSKNE